MVRWVRHFSEAHQVVLIEGNHEEKHRRWRHHQRQGSPVADTMTGIERMAALNQALSAEDIAFLETGQLYFYMPQYHALAVHAGVPPAIETLPADPREIAAYPRKQRDIYMQMLRIRFVSPEGKIRRLGDETEDDRYWATFYDGRWALSTLAISLLMILPRWSLRTPSGWIWPRCTAVSGCAVLADRGVDLPPGTRTPGLRLIHVRDGTHRA